MLKNSIKKYLNLNILNIKGSALLYKGIKKLKLIPFKNLKIYILNYNRIFKNIYLKILNFFIVRIISIFLFLIKVLNNLVLKIKILKLCKYLLYKLYTIIFIFRQIINLSELKIKRKNRINPKLKIKAKSLKKKYIYKKKFLEYVKQRRKINVNLNMFTRKIRRKQKKHFKMIENRQVLAKNINSYVKTNEKFLNFEFLIKDKILPKIDSCYYILYRINKILNVFKKNKTIFLIKTITENFLKKINSLSLYLNHNLFALNRIKNFDKLFKTLFISRVFKIKKGKSYNKKFYKTPVQLYMFSFIFVLYSLLKKVLFLNALFNMKSMNYILDKLDIFFSAKNMIGYYATRYSY